MRKTKSKCFDVGTLEKRIAVSDQELAFLLGVGLVTARKIATDAGAVFRVGKIKSNDLEKVKRYVNTMSGE